jgi:hypothetical protein
MTGRLLTRCHETGFNVSRPRHLVSGGARLLRASGSSVPPYCNASWPGRNSSLESCRTRAPVPCGKICERAPCATASFRLEDNRRREAVNDNRLISEGKWLVTGFWETGQPASFQNAGRDRAGRRRRSGTALPSAFTGSRLNGQWPSDAPSFRGDFAEDLGVTVAGGVAIDSVAGSWRRTRPGGRGV